MPPSTLTSHQSGRTRSSIRCGAYSAVWKSYVDAHHDSTRPGEQCPRTTQRRSLSHAYEWRALRCPNILREHRIIAMSQCCRVEDTSDRWRPPALQPSVSDPEHRARASHTDGVHREDISIYNGKTTCRRTLSNRCLRNNAIISKSAHVHDDHKTNPADLDERHNLNCPCFEMIDLLVTQSHTLLLRRRRISKSGW